MGRIINSKIFSENKVIYKILLEESDLQKIKGHFKNIHLFAGGLCNKETQINQRGKKGVTKYFKIPLEVRTRKKYTGIISYQRLDSATKSFYIYVLNKFSTNNGTQ